MVRGLRRLGYDRPPRSNFEAHSLLISASVPLELISVGIF